MRRLAIMIAVMAGCASDPAPPSCQQAFAHYYAGGCTFVDLATGQPVPQGQVTADCQSTAASAPASCQGALDDWLGCINETTPAMSCDCSQLQMTLLRCR